MKHWKNENAIGLLLAVSVIAGVSIACSRIKALTMRNTQSDKVNEFYYNLPSGAKSADLEAGDDMQEAFIIVIPDPTQIMLQSVEAEPVTLAQLDEQLKTFAAENSNSKKPVYIAARYDLDWSAITEVLAELQKYKIENVKLLVGPETRPSDPKGTTSKDEKSIGDIPAPDRVFKVKIGGELPPIDITPRIRNESLTVPNTISGGVLNGKAINLPKPAYPTAARAVRASGTVTVQVTVDTDGSVIAANAVSGHLLLRSEAVKAARQAKFSPTMLSGKAVKVNGILVYNFVP
jgi:TonB family protein